LFFYFTKRRASLALGKSSVWNKLGLFLFFLLSLEAAAWAVFCFTDVKYAEGKYFATAGFVRRKPSGALTHVPKSRFRLAGVYGDTIEFDTRQKTNNEGLVDSEDYKPSRAEDPNEIHIALTGDSFVDGDGGYSWPPETRQLVREAGHSVQIYNLSMSGSSFTNYYLLLDEMDRRYAFDRIYLCAISRDLHRTHWRPLIRGSELYYLPDKTKVIADPDKPIFHLRIIEDDATPQEILQMAQKYFREVRQAGRFSLLKKLIYPTHAGRFLIFLKNRITTRINAPPIRRKLEQEAFVMIERIRRRFPERPLAIIHLPMRHEVEKGKYDIDLSAFCDRLDIDYLKPFDDFAFGLNLYHKHDGHPNPSGYRYLAGCVAEYIKTDLEKIPPA